MPTTRLYIAGPITAGQSVALDSDRARYIGRVLRIRPGDDIVVFDGSGSEYHGKIASLGKNRASIDIATEVGVSRESRLCVHLLQGISRGDRMDYVVQKSTELGVARITPVLTAYSVVKLTPERAAKRTHHWRGIVASACEQCGRNILPIVDEPQGLRAALGSFVGQPGARIILDPRGGDTLSASRPDNQQIVLLIGPEGGFSSEEVELAEAAGFDSTTLGPRILRTETAAVAALAALQYQFGDLA